MDESCHTCASHHMRNTNASHVNELRHTCEWAISHVQIQKIPRTWTNYATHVHRVAFQIRMLHTWMNFATHVTELSHIYEWRKSRTHGQITPHMCIMSHVKYECFTREWVAPQRYPAQEWTNRTLISHEQTSVHFLVMPGSLLSITEITEYTYISLI